MASLYMEMRHLKGSKHQITQYNTNNTNNSVAWHEFIINKSRRSTTTKFCLVSSDVNTVTEWLNDNFPQGIYYYRSINNNNITNKNKDDSSSVTVKYAKRGSEETVLVKF